MITNALLLVVIVGLFMISSKLGDLVHLMIKSNENTTKIGKCEEKLEILMIKSLDDSK